MIHLPVKYQNKLFEVAVDKFILRIEKENPNFNSKNLFESAHMLLIINN